MSPSKSTVKEKAKAQIFDKPDATESLPATVSTSPSMLAKKSRVPQRINVETTAPSHRSLPRSLVQNSEISAGKMISVQPTVPGRRSSLSSATSSGSSNPRSSARPPAAYMPSFGKVTDSPSSPSVYIPSSSPVPRSIDTVISAPVIAQSMLTGFKYDPDDKTPPRRKMAAVAAFSATNEAPSSLPPTRTTKRRPLFTVGPNGEALVTPVSSSQASWSSTVHDQAGTITAATSLSHLEADLADFRKVVEAAKGPHDPSRRSESSITRQPYKIAKKLDPSDIEERIQRANCATLLERLGEPHTRLSTMTDCSIPFCSENAEPEAESSSVHMSLLEVQDTKISESVIPHSNILPSSPPRDSCSSSQESHALSPTASQNSRTSDTSVSFLPTEKISQKQPQVKDKAAIETNKDLAFNSLRSFRHSPGLSTNRGGRRNSLPDLRDRSMLTVPSGVSEDVSRGDASSTHISVPVPVPLLYSNVATSETLLANSKDSRSDVEAQMKSPGPCRFPIFLTKSQSHMKENAFSTFYPHFCVDWPNFWCFAAKVVLVATFLTFMVIALVSIRRTKPYPAPPDIFTSSSKTVISEDGSSNLTMSWVGGQAVGFRVSPSYNLTLDPNEPRPDEIRFRFDWSAEGLGMLSGNEKKLVNSIPIPSFEQKLIELVGFLGLFLLIYFIVHRALRFLSELGHRRENRHLYTTKSFLAWFDRGIDWVSLVLGVVGSTLIWARATLVFLLW